MTHEEDALNAAQRELDDAIEAVSGWLDVDGYAVAEILPDLKRLNGARVRLLALQQRVRTDMIPARDEGLRAALRNGGEVFGVLSKDGAFTCFSLTAPNGGKTRFGVSREAFDAMVTIAARLHGEETTLARFNEGMRGVEISPLERLRFFCSLALSAQEWLDAEPLFDAVEKVIP